MWRIVIIVAGFFFSLDSSAEGYVSLKEGIGVDIGNFSTSSSLGYFHYADPFNQHVREVGFNWGSKEWIKLVGNVKVESGNSIKNYALGVIIADNDRISVREEKVQGPLMWQPDAQLNMKDTLIENVNASRRELEYDHGELAIVYGQSNAPMSIRFSGNNSTPQISPGNSNTQTTLGSLAVTHPTIEYLAVGRHSSQLDQLLSDGETGLHDYAGGTAGFGLIKAKLGQNIYSSDYTWDWNNNIANFTSTNTPYGNTPAGKAFIDAMGIRGQSVTDFMMLVDMEVGYAYLLNSGEYKGAICANIFMNGYMPLGYILNNGKGSTTSGATWDIGGSMIYGVSVRVAVAF